MKQSIYKSWKYYFNQTFWIQERFEKKSYDEMFYACCLKTMRYISNNLQFANTDFKQELKNDLKECRQYFIDNNHC
jgi:hypothetical protein